MKNIYRRIDAVIKDTGAMPYSTTIRPGMDPEVQMMFSFDPKLNKHLRKKWKSRVDENGFIEFTRKNIEVIVS